MRPTAAVPATAVLAATLALAACGGSGPEAPAQEGTTTAAEESGPLLVYSGRNENLVAPVVERLQEELGVTVEVRYAGTGELAAQLLEEGQRTEADVFFGQDAGALGALARAGLLAPLDDDVLDLVPEQYRDAEGRWVATSGRARVLAYDPEQAPEVTSITGIDEILEPAWKGRIAYAPTNASFHAFVTALRVDRGDDAAREWLEAFAAQDPQAYDNNSAVLAAVDGGQAAIGLINHYYWYQDVAERGADTVRARIHFLSADDPGALVNVAGAGVVTGTDSPETAQAAVAYLLSEESQQYFADETAEYPVLAGIRSTVHDLQPLTEVEGHRIDLNDLDTLEETLAMLDEVGLT